MFVCVCVCMYVCARVFVCVCACACVCLCLLGSVGMQCDCISDVYSMCIASISICDVIQFSCNIHTYLFNTPILPCFRTLYYALTASGGTTLYALDVREQGNRMPSRIFPGMPNGRRRRQACPDPPSFDLGQGFTTDANGRAWMSSTDTGDIWSCAVSGSQLCNCMSEVSNASTSVQALAVDEARVYWTDTNGVFYVELDSNRTVFITLSTMATTQLLATSPGLQQLPGASVLSGAPFTHI